MYACLHLPGFPLQAQLCRNPGWRWEPVGLLDAAARRTDSDPGSSCRPPTLLALTPSAMNAGVELGMTAAQAQARCGKLRLLVRDREAETASQERLLKIAASRSADFESTAPGLVTIDLGAVPGFSRDDFLQRQGHEWIATLAEDELEARVGFAPHPDLAALASKLPEAVTLFRGDESSLLKQLADYPLEILSLPPAIEATLVLWGIGTLGELTALPRDEVIERLGPEAAIAWDQAAGRGGRLIRLVRPPVDFELVVDFDDELTTLEPLMFRLRRSLDTLSARLEGVYLATSEMSLTLRFADGSAAEEVIRVPEASREVERLFPLLHTRLEALAVNRPVEGYWLRLQPARPGEQPFHLFDTTLRDPNRFADTLAQLEALVGSENAGTPVPVDTHLPDAFLMRPFDPDDSGPDKDKADPVKFLAAVQGLPLRRFRPPRPIEMETMRDPLTGRARPTKIQSGEIRGSVRHLTGPWPLSGDWWESARRWRREEWDIQLEDGSLYRIACVYDQPGQESATGPEPRWYLDGVYG